MKIIGIIPSRLKSTRLPNKALVDIEGLPMIAHVFKRAQLSLELDDVYVATDSVEIKNIVESHGGKVIMTSEKHRNGTERLHEAAASLNADVVVNIQGDEPLLDPEHIDKIVGVMRSDATIDVAVLVTSYDRANSPSDIKAVLDKDGNILYCSRQDIPSSARTQPKNLWKMSFIVPMRKKTLEDFVKWDESPLEKVEFIEHLRFLENGCRMRAVEVEKAHISVDTPQDLEEVRKIMVKDIIRQQYMSVRNAI